MSNKPRQTDVYSCYSTCLNENHAVWNMTSN